MISDDWQLLPTINLLASEIRSLNGIFFVTTRPKAAFFVSQLSANEGRG